MISNSMSPYEKPEAYDKPDSRFKPEHTFDMISHFATLYSAVNEIREFNKSVDPSDLDMLQNYIVGGSVSQFYKTYAGIVQELSKDADNLEILKYNGVPNQSKIEELKSKIEKKYVTIPGDDIENSSKKTNHKEKDFSNVLGF